MGVVRNVLVWVVVVGSIGLSVVISMWNRFRFWVYIDCSCVLVFFCLVIIYGFLLLM